MSALRSLSAAMFKGFYRDRMTLFWTILFPLIFLVLFGGVFTGNGVSKVSVVQVGPVSLFDHATGQTRAALKDTLEVTQATDRTAAQQQVRTGDKDAAVWQDGDTLVLTYSAASQTKAAQVQGLMSSFVNASNLAATGKPPATRLETMTVEDSSLKPIQYVTPGILGWAIAMGATFGAAINLVAWRKSGMLRRLRLAPIPTWAVVLARVGVAIVVALGQAAIFIGLAVAVFGLRLTGWWPLIIPLIMVGTLAFLAIGLLVGSFAKTEESASGLANLIVLPMAFLSGTFIPLDQAPQWIRTISHAFPLRYLNEGMLDVMVRGQGPSAIVVPILVMLAFAVVLALVASRVFRWDVR
ncbi:ABC-2 type transport system permease protein [Branchiibius hedensis]|uniref:ABC-2 type transport system permease protein n=1 Tax=Branchiibius hedensis TaxID=672460 RepID=A0A2Y8ZTQ5_9MICO|nr:ABC transporter permease [Branchiibius hedensis]PWJ25835.1 ABC-2 type transport system permease protein [Branchiibius hedensis]SSA34648.1 ABC-2 type transport system permease protein [Branchiibius hedensis]